MFCEGLNELIHVKNLELHLHKISFILAIIIDSLTSDS